jgi:hypothetical protein
VRIDRVRNQIAAVRTLLDSAEEHLDDLHVLAYDRQTAVDRQRVAGGEPNYVLIDTHGDRRARDLLRDGMKLTDSTCANLAAWCYEIRTYLADGQLGSRRTPQMVSADEMIDALTAQRRRKERGEYVPKRTYPQNVDALLELVASLEKQLEKALSKQAKGA